MSDTETTHTPGPLDYEQCLNGGGEPIPYQFTVTAPITPPPGCDDASFVVAETSTRANAARIVRCCNSHDELLRLLRMRVGYDERQGWSIRERRDWTFATRAAIAKATN